MMPNRRLRDAALLLPLAGALLLLPPYIRVFDQDVTVLGLPLLHVYLFGIWLLGIVLTAMLSRRLARHIAAPTEDGQDGGNGEPPATGG